MKDRRGGEDSVISKAATEAVNTTLANMENVRSQLSQFMAVSDAEVLAQMGPLARAQSLLVLAKTINTLVALRLRCSGVRPSDHPVQRELERLKLYKKKLDHCMGLSKEPSRPTDTLDYQAATCFIERSLPYLTTEQKKNIRNIGRGATIKSRLAEHDNIQKRPKHQSNEKQSVQAANEEFLQKVARDIFASSRSRTNVKDPLQLKAAVADEKME